jgi:O-antigen/teichoic acid export membrane protein
MDSGRHIQAVMTHLRTPLYRDAYALLFSSAITSALGVAYWAFAARLYTADAVGIASVILSTMVLLSSLTQLNGRVALVRFIPQAGDDAGRFATLWYIVTTVLGVLVGVGFIATIGLWQSLTPSLSALADVPLAFWFVIAVASWTLFNLQDGLLTGLGRATIVPIENTAYAVTKLIVLIALAGWAGEKAIVVSWTLPAAVVVIVVTALIFGRLVPAYRRANKDRRLHVSTQRLTRFLALDYVAYVLATCTATLLPPIVLTIAGASQSGYFYIPWVILTSLMLIPVYLSTSLTVQSAGSLVILQQHFWAVVRHVYRLLIPVVIGVIVFAPWILTVFGSDYATQGTGLLQVASLGLIPYAVNILFMAVARVARRGRAIVAVQAALTFLTLLLSIMFLGPFGITGVGLAWLVANALVAVVVIPVGLRPLLGRSVVNQDEASAG